MEVKRKLACALNAFLVPIRERRATYAAEPERIEAIIDAGNVRMRHEARETPDIRLMDDRHWLFSGQ